MPPKGRGSSSDDVADRSIYSSNRRRSGSRLRAVAVLLWLIGCAVVGFALLNLYVPKTTNPVYLDTDPLISLGTVGTAGGLLAMFSMLVYVFAYRAGV